MICAAITAMAAIISAVGTDSDRLCYGDHCHAAPDDDDDHSTLQR
jgi:hypothetical protein